MIDNIDVKFGNNPTTAAIRSLRNFLRRSRIKEKIMNIKKPVNENYAATIVSIKSKSDIPGFDNLVSTNIFGNNTLIAKNTPVGIFGIYFPPETKLSETFLKANNLYRNTDLNTDKTKKGYFEENGRVRTVKFRGFSSMGIWMDLSSLSYLLNEKELTSLKEGDTFDEINGIKICEKYIIKRVPVRSPKEAKANKRLLKISKLLANQFRFHPDTTQLGKVVHALNPSDMIGISSKVHGTSIVISNILCKRYLNSIERIMKFVGIKIKDTEYSNVFSSRKVVQNDELNPNKNAFYSENIYAIVNKEMKEYLTEGMTIYAEICGFLPGGSPVQKDYDYGCETGIHKTYIYRITYTNPQGYIYEFSIKQLYQWCGERNLPTVPELYYGYAKDLFPEINTQHHWHEDFLEKLKEKYLESDCVICKNKVPDEGIVLRVDGLTWSVAKLKSFRFFEHETKLLDKGETNIEDNQEVE